MLVSVDSIAAASVDSTAEVSGVFVGTSWPNAKIDITISIIENMFFIILYLFQKYSKNSILWTILQNLIPH